VTNIIGAAIAFAVALLLSFANYLISRAIMKKSPQYYSFGAIIHQAINVAYMVLLYFIAPKTPFDAVYLLVGAVLGITAGLVLFTSMLLKNTKNGK
jgi:hypothetical protein